MGLGLFFLIVLIAVCTLFAAAFFYAGVLMRLREDPTVYGLFMTIPVGDLVNHPHAKEVISLAKMPESYFDQLEEQEFVQRFRLVEGVRNSASLIIENCKLKGLEVDSLLHNIYEHAQIAYSLMSERMAKLIQKELEHPFYQLLRKRR